MPPRDCPGAAVSAAARRGKEARVSSVRAPGDVQDALADLAPLVRRVIAARVRDQHTVDDLVQETLARVMAARPRLKDSGLAP